MPASPMIDRTPRNSQRRTARPAPRLHAVAVALASMGLVAAVQAQQAADTLPLGEVIARGAATVTRNGALMTINQSSNRAAIEWNSFNIGSAATVNHVTPGASAITLHRVTGTGGTSLIDGTLSSNGRVFLVNTSGVVFSSTARVNVGSLVASSRDLDPALTANNYAGFEAASQLSFTQGTDLSDGTFGDQVTVESGAELTTGPDGSLMLIAGRRVAVSGALTTASGGTLALVVAPSTTVNLTESGFVQLVSTAGNATNVSTTRSVTIASGSVSAPDGLVQIQARGNAADEVTVSLSNATVDVRGATAGDRRIEIVAAGNTGATITMTGATLDASSDAETGVGGSIAVAAPRISINAAPLPSIVAAAEPQPGFDNTLRADGTEGGGTIEIGEAASLGTLELGPTRSILLDGSTFVSASALTQGNGGRIDVVSTHNQTPVEGSAQPVEDFGVVQAFGSLVARGAGTGSGGLITTQAPALSFATEGGGVSVDASAGANGTVAGTWRMEAFDATITTSGTADVSTPSVQLGQDEINRALDSGTSVTLVARSPDGGSGVNVQVQGGVAITRSAGTVPVTLSLQAQSDVILEAGSSIVSQSGALNVQLAANIDGGGNGGVELRGETGGSSGPLPVTITTLGGDLTIGGGADPAAGLAERRGQRGVAISGAAINTNGEGTAGNISIRGRGGVEDGEGIIGAEGVTIADSDLKGNDIAVLGAGSAGNGVRIENSTLSTATGSIDVRGTLVDAVGSSPASGVLLGSGVNVDLGSTGTLTVAGHATLASEVVNEGTMAGVMIDSVQVTRGSRVTLAGETDVAGGFGVLHAADSGSGLTIGGVEGGESSADVVLGGFAGTGAGERALSISALRVNTTGRVNFRPLAVAVTTGEDGIPAVDIGEASDASIGVGATTTNDMDFLVQGQWLGALDQASFVQAGTIVIGSSQHTGQIRVGSGAMADSAAGTRVSLQNQGQAGGEDTPGSITFEGSAGGAGLAELSLLTAGNITQAGPLTVAQLVIQGGPQSDIDLRNEGNNIGAVSFDPPSALRLSTADTLSINSGTARGFDTSGGFTETTITVNQAGQTLELRSLNGDVVLDTSIEMTSANAAVDLVAGGTFRNPGNATISFGENPGGQWRIWSATLEGFQAGGLAGTTPNFFDCSFGNCEAPTGNVFLFAQAAPAVPPPTGLPFDLNDPGLFQDFRTHLFLDQQRSDVYGLNTPSRPQICAAVSTIQGISEPELQADPLSVEWTRVRSQPQLSSCLDLNNGNACASF
jgi:filamentous hemagglutinin family protein